MTRLPRLILAALCVLAMQRTACAATVGVTIVGIKGDLEDAVRSGLTLVQQGNRDLTPAQIRSLFARGKEEIQGALEPYGYYNAHVQSRLERNAKAFSARFEIDPGAPVIVRRSQVRIQGPGAEMPQVKRALRRFTPAPGERFDHGVYEQSKGAIESALANTGFLRASAAAHRVEVSRKANTADINLDWQSGPRMRFGAARFSEAQFPPKFLERFVPWHPGDYYSPDELLAFQQKLIDADYFATVIVQPDLSNKNSVDVPIDVQLAPAKRNVYTASLYISTDTGPGVRLGDNRRWLNDKGHKADVALDFAQRLEAIAAGYHIPLPGPADRSLNFGVAYRDENTATTKSRTERTTANETRQWLGFTRTLGMQYIAGNFDVADEHHYSTLFFAEATLSKKKANNLVFPRRGYALNFSARFAPQGFLSDTSFVQLTADGHWILPAGARQRLLMRSTLGWMGVQDFDRLTPDLRFFAGGDRSVRGFNYQQLGSTNANGQVVGGTHLAVASAEFERYFLPKWGGAVFLDGGDAFRDATFKLNLAAGIGVRWRSPVGILRLDVAKPLVSDLAHSLRFHITIGPDL